MTLLNSQGNITTTLHEKLSTWEKYVYNLYNDKKYDKHGIESAAKVPNILPDQIEYAINQLKNGKVPRPDEIHGGIMKLVDAVGIRKLTKL